jgi:hypothetical protein
MALKSIGKPFAYVNIFDDPEIREGLKKYSNWPTFPQLYVNGELIGVASPLPRDPVAPRPAGRPRGALPRKPAGTG